MVNVGGFGIIPMNSDQNRRQNETLSDMIKKMQHDEAAAEDAKLPGAQFLAFFFKSAVTMAVMFHVSNYSTVCPIIIVYAVPKSQ